MEKLDPKAIWIFFLRRGGGFALIFMLLIAGWLPINFGVPKTEEFIFKLWIIGIFFSVLLVFICYIWAKLYYNFYKFELTKDAFKKECGIIWKKYIAISYKKIQKVEVRRDIIDRIMGLSTLIIQTAGYPEGEAKEKEEFGLEEFEPTGKVSGLSKLKAEAIKEELIKRAEIASSEL